MGRRIIILVLVLLLYAQISYFGLSDCDKCKYELNGEIVSSKQVFETYIDTCLRSDEFKEFVGPLPYPTATPPQ